MSTAFIICGALGREVMAIIARHGWVVDVYGIPAIAHMRPERIAPAVEQKFHAIRRQHEHVLVVYGDCGTRGALDAFLDANGLERIAGPHCYEMYGGPLFDDLMAEEPGTFFLTDFLVRGFRGTIWRGLGLDRFPELRDDYFRHYRRLVYLTQIPADDALRAKAEEIAAVLDLPLDIRPTGYGLLEQRLCDWMERHALNLLKQALNGGRPTTRMWRAHELKERYDVVIIGGGAHGLACAYYLARYHGITDVAVLEKGYIGSGGSGRNTTIIRSNYLTPEGVRFYDESVKLYEAMSAEFDFNVMFSQRGHLTLAHTDSAVRTARRRAEVNQLQGVDSRVIFPDEIARLCPMLDVSDHPRYPILGALYHPPGGIIRHDAVVWGYAHHADRRGVHIHQLTEVTGITVENNRVTGVQTNRGFIHTGTVLNATAGWCTTIADMAGVRLPITTFPLQACVTEPLKPFLDVIIVSGSLHVYVSQSDRGELVMGASVDPFASYSMDGSLSFVENLAGHMLELFPALHHVRVLRQWAGLCDMTPDFSPVMGFTPVEGFLVDVGWGTWGFKASPVSGKRMAELIATNRTPDLIHPFRLSRFEENDLVGEKGAASVGH